MSSIVFLGGGRITSALVVGLRRSGFRGKLVVHDRHAEKLRRLRRFYGVTPESNLDCAVAASRILIIAVRPAEVRELLSSIAAPASGRFFGLNKSPRNSKPIIAISLAAGVPLARLRDALGAPVRWVRAMPSPACRARRGLTALAFGPGVPGRKRNEIRAFFARVGTVIEIPEKQFDAFTVTYSSSHGYHALSVLAHAAARVGLAPRVARLAAAHALADGIMAWRESGESLTALLKEAATPGGTASAVMVAMDAGGYSRIVERALRAGIAVARSRGGK